MAKRSSRSAAPKTSGGSLVPILVGVGVLGAAAILLMPKKASAAQNPPAQNPPATGGDTKSGSVTVHVVSSGTSPTQSPDLSAITYVVSKTDDKGVPLPANGAQGYLEAYDAQGKPLYGPLNAEPSVVTITKPQFLTHDADLGALLADGSFSNYTTGAEANKILAAGGKVLIWTVDNSSGNVLKWWLTQWS